MTRPFFMLAAFVVANAFTSPDPGDKPLRASQLLRSVQNSRQVQASKRLTAYAIGLNYDLPWVKEVGLRFGADDFSDASLRFGASFSFHSPAVRRLQGQNGKAIGDFYAAKQAVSFNEEMANCYRQIAALYTDELLAEKHVQLDSLLKIHNHALRTALDLGIPVGAKTLVAAEDDQRDARLSILDFGNKTSFLKQQLSPLNAGKADFQLEQNGFISVENIRSVIKSLGRSPWANQQTPMMMEAQGQQKLNQLGLKLQQAADRQWLDGVQLIHQVNNDPLFGGGLSFRFGLNIPLRSGNRPKQNELMMDLKEAETELEQLSFLQKTMVEQQLLLVDGMLSEFDILEKLHEKSLVGKVLGTPSLLATLPPTELVELRIVACKKEIELLDSYAELLQEFVNLMELTGELVKAPLRNYLSDGLELIGNQ